MSFAEIFSLYNWQGMLVHLIGLIILTKLSWAIAFKIPAIQTMREWNRTEDKPKKAKPKYRPVMKQTATVGLYMHLLFFLVLRNRKKLLVQ